MSGISPNVIIMTRDELSERENRAFQRGVARGRFEESWDRTYGIPKLGVGVDGKGYADQIESVRKEYAGAEPGESGPPDTHLSCLESNQAGGKPAPEGTNA